MPGKTQGSKRTHPIRDVKAMPGSAAAHSTNKRPGPPRKPPMLSGKKG